MVLPTRRTVLALAGAAFAAPPARAQSAAAAALKNDGVHDIEVSSRAIDRFGRASSATKFGRLEFRGGLVLTSSEKNFGGLSGLVIEPDGRRFLAITDEGHWLGGEITYSGTAPSGIARARMGDITATSGRALTRKRDADCEGLALVSGNLTNGVALLSFERNARIGRFPIVNGVLQPPAGYLRTPPEAKKLKSNRGFESVTVVPAGPHKGAVVAFAERYTDSRGHHTGWVWQQGEPRPIYLTDIDGFDVTDLAALGDGSIIVLERRFRWTEGVQMRMRLIKAEALVPGSVLEPEVLLAADMMSEIDNMEGLAVHRSPQGDVVLTLVSDDNFNSFLQRTILLQFTLR